MAIVTGSSKGIGEAVATILAKQGARVAINYNTGSHLTDKIIQNIRSIGGIAIPIQADVSNESQVADMVKQVVGEWGRIDVLINNAGITRDRLIIRMKVSDWDEVINVNLRGAFLCTRAVLPHMIKQKSGTIINISSVVGLLGNAGQANYVASKAGLIGLTKSVAREVASRGITVNAVAPGYITTSMVDNLSSEAKEAILNRVPLSRFGTSYDIADTVAFLCSDGGARYITGQVIGVDGGLGM